MAEKDEFGRVIQKKVPLEGVRKIITERMTESILKYPQGSAFVTADMEPLIGFREDLKSQGKKVTFGDLFVKIASCALEENMELNASRLGNEIVYYDNINIGMMAEVNGYLMEPVLEDVQSKTIEQVSKELASMYAYMKKGKLARVKMGGSTFSVTNLGMYDVDGFTPLLSPPAGGILGVGSTRKAPVVNEQDEIVVRRQITLSITTDHGLVDGISVMKFLQSVKKVMASPEEYMYKVRGTMEAIA